MEYRELLRQQELRAQRREHGPAADASERSLRLYPGNALREVVSVSAHPLNLEPLLLTLAREENADLRARFGEAAGEVVLIGKALGYAAVVGDLQVVSGRRVVDARDGLAYPAVDATPEAAARAKRTTLLMSKKDEADEEEEDAAAKAAAEAAAKAEAEAAADDHGTGFLPHPDPVSYEVWTRVEALAALTAMLRERVPRALLMAPPMQLRLLEELAGLAAGAEGADAEAEAAAALAAADAEAEAAAADEAKAREEAAKEKKDKEGEEQKKEGDDPEEEQKRQQEQAELKRAAEKARRKERAAVAVAARRHPLLRLHALLALVEALKLLHAARPDAVHLHVDAKAAAAGGAEAAAAGFDLLLVRAAMGLLEAAATADDVGEEEGEGKGKDEPKKQQPSLAASARQLFRGDPVQRAKALAASCELLYLLASTAAPGTGGTGNYVPSNAPAQAAQQQQQGAGGQEDGQQAPPASSSASSSGGDPRSCVRLMEGPPPAASPLGAPALAARGAAPVLARAVEAAAALLQARRDASEGKFGGAARGAPPKPFAPEQQAEGDVPFGVNWRHYLGAALPSAECAEQARVALELGGALLQAVALSAPAAKGSKQQKLWPSEASLRALAEYEAAPAAGGEASAAGERQLAESAAAVGALLLASAGYDEASAGAAPQRLHVAARAAHRALADARLGKRCSACGKQEGMGGPAEVAPLKRCAACHRDWYCGAACQRAAWKGLMHKELCAQIGGGALRRQRAEGMGGGGGAAGKEMAGEAAAAAVEAVAIK